VFSPRWLPDATLENLEDPSYQACLRRAISEDLVLILHNFGTLSADEHLRIASIFGPVQDSLDHVDEAVPQTRLVQAIDRNAPDSVAESRRPSSYYWHTDRSFLPNPAFVTVLNMWRMPTSGGDTYFFDTRSAFANLNAIDKQRLRCCRARHSYSHYHNVLQAGQFDAPTKRLAEKLYPDVWQPLVLRDYTTESEALYFSELCVNGLEYHGPKTETPPTIAWIAKQFESDDMVYRHNWSEGDVVIWNNLATMHRSEPSTGYRQLRRVITGCLPSDVDIRQSSEAVCHAF
jgi:alpha-ketoglutarate-dependent taurine dioxygenase